VTTLTTGADAAGGALLVEGAVLVVAVAVAVAGVAGLSASGAEVLEQATRLKAMDALNSVSNAKLAGKRAAKFMLYKS
jgi:hypothetical protein